MMDILQKLTWRKPNWLLVSILGVVVIYGLVWLILVNKKQGLQRQIIEGEESIPVMHKMADRLQINNSNNSLKPQVDKMTLATRVSTLSKQYGLQGVKIKSGSNDKVTLDFNAVNFIRLHGVIFNLEYNWGVEIVKADFKKINKRPGMVSGSLILTR